MGSNCFINWIFYYYDLNILVGAIISLNFEVYECVDCKEKFVPSFKEYIFGPHTLTKRYLKYPYCHKKGWDNFSI